MFRFMRKREGFTLIELMMVVAVIGILAAVLIPKIGGTKDNAKLAGVDSNVRTVQASVESMISRYQHRNASSAASFATALEGTLTNVVNPLTNVSGADVVTGTSGVASSLTTGNAVTINSTSGALKTADGTAANKGSVLVTLAETGSGTGPWNITTVTITSYDNLGNALPNTVIVP